MKKQIRIFWILILLILSFPQVKAQPGFDDEVQDTPIDGGLGALVAAGIFYGMKKKANCKSNKPINKKD